MRIETAIRRHLGDKRENLSAAIGLEIRENQPVA